MTHLDNLDHLLDELLDEVAMADVFRKCDELLKAFSRSPLHKKENVGELEMLEWEIANPMESLCLGDEGECARFMDMPEMEQAALLNGVVKSSMYSRDCFLATILGYTWFFADVEKDQEYIRRGGHMFSDDLS